MLKIKRVYEDPSPDDGVRILVDRVWPRGMTKEEAHISEWRKDLAPSTELRKWYGHDPAKWDEFRRRYKEELVSGGAMEYLKELATRAKKETISLVFGAKDTEHSQAKALQEFAREL